MTIGAVLPVKDTGDAKQRLAGFLSAAERQRLALAMAEDVLATLARVTGLSGIVVVTRDERAAALAARHGARVLTEPSNDGQSAAVERAAAALGREGADGLLQVPGDVPGASADEIEAVLADHEGAGDGGPAVTLVPSHDRRGTNCVLCTPPGALPFAFGHDSFGPHCEAARARGIAPRIPPAAGTGPGYRRARRPPRLHRAAGAGPHPRLSPRERDRRAPSCDRRGLRRMHDATRDLLEAVQGGHRPDAAEALALAAEDDLAPLLDCAAALRDRAHPDVVTYSRKVFIPLTHLCRDVCHYCTFARPPRRGETAFMTPEEVLRVAEAGAAAGCKEALFTLGDKPELRYRAAREGLEALGYDSTLAYLADMAKLVLEKTPLLPHLNPGVLGRDDLRVLREVSASQGMMLESASERLAAKGGPHYGSPDKRPAARLETLRLAGEEAVPFTSGILIGIGETRAERIEALLALRDAHEAHRHIQEIIVQNFRRSRGRAWPRRRNRRLTNCSGPSRPPASSSGRRRTSRRRPT